MRVEGSNPSCPTNTENDLALIKKQLSHNSISPYINKINYGANELAQTKKELFLSLKKLSSVYGIGQNTLSVKGTSFNLRIRSSYKIELLFIDVKYLQDYINKSKTPYSFLSAFEEPKSIPEFDKRRCFPYFIDIMDLLPDDLQSFLIVRIADIADYDASEMVRSSFNINNDYLNFL